MNRRMCSEEQRAGYHHQHEGREEDGCLVINEQVVILAFRLGYQARHHEDTIVDTDTEDEGSDDDVNQVELQAEDAHDALHHVPAQAHRQESDEGNRNTTE